MPLRRTRSFGGRKAPLRTGARAASVDASVSARQSAARSASMGLKRAASVRESAVIRTALSQSERNVFLHKEEKYFKAKSAKYSMRIRCRLSCLEKECIMYHIIIVYYV